MAARFWRWVLSVVVLLAATVAGALALTFSLAAWTALWIAVAILLAMPVLFAAASLAAAGAWSPPGRSWSAAGGAVRAVLSEAVHFGLAILRMCTDPRQRPPAPAADPPRPVLLIHGIVCNRGVWQAVQRRLQAAQLAPIGAVNLEPLFDDIELQAQRVEPEVLALQRQCSGARVIVVAHSMGGLVARALLRRVGPGVISRIVTIGSPHHGTMLARGLNWPATRQMAPESPWLGALNASQEGAFAIPVTSIYSLEDNLLAPARTARLRGAQWQEMRGLGHFGLLNSRRSLDAIMAALRPECPE
jgi:pimeloyl-ACP methyl ester carboxylesterase